MFEENQEQDREDKRYPNRINEPLHNEIEIVLGIEDYFKNSPPSKRSTSIKRNIASKKENRGFGFFPPSQPFFFLPHSKAILVMTRNC